jgi:ribosomal protein L37E
LEKLNIGFKIMCNSCGNIVTVLNDTSNKDYSNYFFYPIQNNKINIVCKHCGNEVYIGED